MPAASTPPAWIEVLGLPQAWHGQAAWHVLDTDFGDGERLVQLWRAWTRDPHACRMLHVVAFADGAPARDRLLAMLQAQPDAAALAAELDSQWFGLLPGFHRLVLHGGQLQLTLCIGPKMALLREQRFLADSMVIGPVSEPDLAAAPGAGAQQWDAWAIKALARLCRRGSTLAVLPCSGLDAQAVSAAGWVACAAVSTKAAPTGLWSVQYQPTWQIKATRARWAQAPASVSHCVVVGAGLAGAAVAGALSLRGWQVTVLDASADRATGASGLPVGLFAPQVSRDDGIRSRLSRAGIRATLQAAQRLLTHGQDWAWSGIAQVDAAADALPADWPVHGSAWAATVHSAPLARRKLLGSLAQTDRALWHAAAGWIKPQRLVRAWLDQPGVCFLGGSPVQSIMLDGGLWHLLGPHGRALAEAPQLVIACAGGSAVLLQLALSAARQTVPVSPLAMTPVQGQVSWAWHTPQDARFFPPFPVNGAGSVTPHVPWDGAAAWFAGASYEPLGEAQLSTAQAHAQNLARLAQLLPHAAAAVSLAFSSDTVQAWRGTRWTLGDRLPVVGAWPTPAGNMPLPGLWLSTAMGSRALTHAALCGELIAAQMGGEPLPVDTGLHKCIDAQRVRAHGRAQSPTGS